MQFINLHLLIINQPCVVRRVEEKFVQTPAQNPSLSSHIVQLIANLAGERFNDKKVKLANAVDCSLHQKLFQTENMTIFIFKITR